MQNEHWNDSENFYVPEKLRKSMSNRKPFTSSSDSNYQGCKHKQRNWNSRAQGESWDSQPQLEQLKIINPDNSITNRSSSTLDASHEKCSSGQTFKIQQKSNSSRQVNFQGEGKIKVEEFSKAVLKSYGFSSIDGLMNSCFDKTYKFKLIIEHNMYRYAKNGKQYLYKAEKWNKDQLRRFQVLKRDLNNVKGELDDYDLNEWHRHTRATNPADLVMRRLRTEMKVEFLTQAWCKFYELVTEFDLGPKDDKKSHSFYSIHLCEAPGAFVASLNHYLKSKYSNTRWEWMANSLNPYYEGNTPSQMINDDRFMLQTIENWDFGPDMTGDVTHPNYPDHLRVKCGDYRPHLVTADGSFDCQDKPEEQETSVSWLHLRETLTALRILRKGGHFVIKMFTFFECDTICLLYLLRIMFISLQVKKPATSKEGNSEIYVVCKEFKGNEVAEVFLKDLLPITQEEHQNRAMFPYEHINRNFMNEVYECAQMFAGRQISVIKRNIELFPFRHDEKLRSQFQLIQEKLWQGYIKKYEIKPIDRYDNIVPIPNRSYEARKRFNVLEKREFKQGSHADQVKRKSLPKEEVFTRISNELDSLGVYCMIKETYMPKISIKIQDFKMIYGKPIETVMCSQFCYGTFIRLRNELMERVSTASYNKFSSDVSVFDSDEYNEKKFCDFRSTFMGEKSYSEAQCVAFREICDKLLELVDGEDLTLIGFPLLTQFNINVLCYLRQIFEQIEFRNTNILYLRSIRIYEHSKWSPMMDEILRGYSQTFAVLSFLPLEYITGGKNPLYPWLVQVNNIRTYNEILSLINSYRQDVR